MLTASQRLQARLIGALAYPLISALCRTVRWKVDGAEHYEAILASGRQPIIAFWHGRILPAAWYFRRRGIVAMTSANFDGQWTARILEHFGNRTVAGSSSRRGMRAMLEMKRYVERGHPGAFALDGPRGPARVAQPGAAWLSAATGNPLLLFHAEADRHWTVRSWDRTQIPKPFSTVAVVIRPAAGVPNTRKGEIEIASSAMALELSKLQATAFSLLPPAR